MKFLIYEDWVHFIPTGKGWAAGLEALGHEVYQMGHEYKLSQLAEPMDAVIHFDIPTTDEHVNTLKRYKDIYPNTKIIGLAGPFKEEFSKFLGLIDFWCSIGYNYKKVRTAFEDVGFKHYDIPMATDPKIFYPTISTKLYDVSFFGTFGHGYRGQDYYLKPVLDDKSLTFRIGGFSYDGIHYPTVPLNYLNTIYNATRVNLNFHYDSQKEADDSDFNGRMFDIPATGQFMLCDHPDAHEFFDGNAIVGDRDNWLELVQYYKNNKTEREEAAAKLHEHVLKHHTYKNRMELLISIMNGT